ncbi:fluoride efflux transporter CrcB [Arabiibacter massiliensis]|uniref:fluoride efflux transporter CrcB n=1 Tax=Arabiibacter massiliensis TaxID=1870985 RepID=UPI0009BA113E|nr:fluoride efflux transporter CrcB [Arabiibacter massiliensis]
MAALLLVGAGGFIGAVARYLLGLVPYGGDFPLMTFVVNFVGAVAIGAVVEAANGEGAIPPEAALFLKTGVCGGFTTFSTFSLETLTLFEEGRHAMAALYAGGSLAACVLGVAAGRLLMRGALSGLRAS